MSALGNTGKVENLSERRELTDAAKVLLADKAFGHVYKQLRQQWFNQLLELPHDCPMQVEYAARLRALDLIPTSLAKLLENYHVDAQRSARNA